MLDKSLLNRIDEWIDSHKEEYLADLARLVAVPSAANLGVAPGEFPFGEGSAAVLKTAKEMAEGYGFEVENRDNFCLVAHVGTGSEKVGILGHLDVVPCGDDWEYPPYALTRLPDGDTIVGRGVMDDKGPLWASVYAVRCLKELGVLPRRAIEIFMGGDEECGMEDVKHYKAPRTANTPSATAKKALCALISQSRMKAPMWSALSEERFATWLRVMRSWCFPVFLLTKRRRSSPDATA